jgi:hypothetical protein
MVKVFLITLICFSFFQIHAQDKVDLEEDFFYRSEVAIGANGFGYGYLGYEYFFEGKEQWSVYGEVGMAVPLAVYSSGSYYALGSRWFSKPKGYGITLDGFLSYNKGGGYNEYKDKMEFDKRCTVGVKVGYTFLFDQVFSIYPYIGSGLFLDVDSEQTAQQLLGGLQIGFRL